MVIDSGRDSLVYHAPNANDTTETPKTRQLPVTLLSGFLVRSVIWNSLGICANPFLGKR